MGNGNACFSMIYTKEDKTIHSKVNWAQTYLIIVYFRFHNIFSVYAAKSTFPPPSPWWRWSESVTEERWVWRGVRTEWWRQWSVTSAVMMALVCPAMGDNRWQESPGAMWPGGCRRSPTCRGYSDKRSGDMGTLRQNMLGLVLLILSLKGNIQT